PAPAPPFDTLRAAGSAHIIGIARARARGRPRLRPGGALVLSNMVRRNGQCQFGYELFVLQRP
ncbi:MAG: hypothetical protein N4A39_09405, partial [Roseicyclus sp.]|nr:hypothetical protein [Roseicyclus sp.]